MLVFNSVSKYGQGFNFYNVEEYWASCQMKRLGCYLLKIFAGALQEFANLYFGAGKRGL